jgi:aminopeptidase YwaD
MTLKKIILVTLLFVPVLLAQDIVSEEISVQELQQHLNVLASDSLEGRRAGTAGDEKAAEYIRKNLQLDNLLLLGENGYQSFDVIVSIEAGPENALRFDDYQGTLKQDFMPLSFSPSKSVTAPVVCVGYGFDIHLDNLVWQDYKDVDVTNKWVLVLLGDPHPGGGPNPFDSYNSSRKKVLVAQDKGAAGVLFVSGESVSQQDQLAELDHEMSQYSAGLPAIQIKRSIVNRLLKDGATIEDLEKQLNEKRSPHSFVIEKAVTATAQIIKKQAKTQNVLALLAGDDPVLRDEYIVIGAHYDHLGLGGPGSGSRRPDTLAIHNGADDNASGVAAALEVIERLSCQRHNLRSIIFAAFGAEEMGDIGSKYFVNNPIVDLKKIKFMFNVDMVGRMAADSKTVTVTGTGTALGLQQIVEEMALKCALVAKCSPEGYGPSDHASFYSKDIPVLFFMTSMHEDYHTPNDDVEFINFDGLKNVADFVYALLSDMANRTEMPAFQESGPKSRPEMRSSLKVTLGIMPDIAAADIKGVKADAVIPDRPAARAGMLKGDVIIGLEGKPVNDIYEYMNRLSEFRSGQRISVEVLRGSEKIILIVEL